MHRTLIAVFTTLVLGGAALLSCSDRSGNPTEADRSLAGSSLQSDIQTLINAIYGKPGGQLTAANAHFKNIKKACPPPGTSFSTNCQTRVLEFIQEISDKLAEGKLKTTPSCTGGCPAFVPDTTVEAALLLQLFLLEFGGFGDFSGLFDPGAETNDVVIQICLVPGEDCLATVPSGFSGVFRPAGGCNVPCALVGSRIEETFPTDGPLPTDFDQFPLFYNWALVKLGDPPVATGGLAPAGRRLALAQGQFDNGVVGEIALCVVDSGAFAPDSSVVGGLVLAHPDPADSTQIETLELSGAPNVPIDCTGATVEEPSFGLTPAGRRLTLASPGKLGAALSQFSPFAAVDTTSGGEETVTSLTINEDAEEVFLNDGDVAGMLANVSGDPGGGNVTFTVDPSGAFTTKDVFEGSASASLGCDISGYGTEGDVEVGFGDHTVVADFDGAPGFNPSTSNTVTVHCLPEG